MLQLLIYYNRKRSSAEVYFWTPDATKIDQVTEEKISHLTNKKAELSQRWPRDARYVRVPWKFSGVPDYSHGYFSRNF